MKIGALISFVVVAFVAILVYVSRPQTFEQRVTNNTPAQQAAVLPADEASGLVPGVNAGIQLEVPDFEVQTTSGKVVTLSGLVEDKPTMVGFWASWCPNCRRNLPIQDELFSRYKDQVNIVEINLREGRGTVDNYAADNDFGFHLAYDEEGVVSMAWGIQYTNTHVLIGGNGELLAAFPGDVTEEHFQQLVESAI